MTKTQTKNTPASSEKLLSIFIAGLIVVGCIANIYDITISLRFIHSALDTVYYLRYLILLVGGLAIGYLVTSRTKHHNRLFESSLYSLLSVTVFFVLDVVRALLQGSFGLLPSPWARISFLMTPLVALAIVAFIAYRRRSSPQHTLVTQKIFVILFVIAQLYYALAGTLQYDQAVSLWTIVSSYLTAPLFIMVVAYLLLGRIKQAWDRLFHAAVVAAIYSYLITFLWIFQPNNSLEAIDISRIVVTSTSLAVAGITLWRIRTTRDV